MEEPNLRRYFRRLQRLASQNRGYQTELPCCRRGLRQLTTGDHRTASSDAGLDTVVPRPLPRRQARVVPSAARTTVHSTACLVTSLAFRIPCRACNATLEPTLQLLFPLQLPLPSPQPPYPPHSDRYLPKHCLLAHPSLARPTAGAPNQCRRRPAGRGGPHLRTGTERTRRNRRAARRAPPGCSFAARAPRARAAGAVPGTIDLQRARTGRSAVVTCFTQFTYSVCSSLHRICSL